MVLITALDGITWNGGRGQGRARRVGAGGRGGHLESEHERGGDHRLVDLRPCGAAAGRASTPVSAGRIAPHCDTVSRCLAPQRVTATRGGHEWAANGHIAKLYHGGAVKGGGGEDGTHALVQAGQPLPAPDLRTQDCYDCGPEKYFPYGLRS